MELLVEADKLPRQCTACNPPPDKHCKHTAELRLMEAIRLAQAEAYAAGQEEMLERCAKTVETSGVWSYGRVAQQVRALHLGVLFERKRTAKLRGLANEKEREK